MRFLNWHMGLGDAIAFADLAVRIADGEPMYVPCWDRNLLSVASIFINHQNITAVPILNSDDLKALTGLHDAICIGHYSGHERRLDEDFVQWCYRTASSSEGIVFHLADRFDNEVVKKAAHAWKPGQLTDVQVKPQTPDHYHFIHQDRERGFNIDPRKNGPAWWEGVCQPEHHPSVSILAWSQLLENAKYVHAIDSAFLHLAEQLRPTGKMHYHRYARPGSEDYHTLRHNWNILT